MFDEPVEEEKEIDSIFGPENTFYTFGQDKSCSDADESVRLITAALQSYWHLEPIIHHLNNGLLNIKGPQQG